MASVAVVVRSREAAKRWYTEQLGLTVLMDMGHWLTVGKKGEGGAIHLCQVDEAGPGVTMEPGNSGILLVVPGTVQEAYDEMKARGVKFEGPPEERPWGWDATVRDPDGNLILLMPSE
ncbi:MAG: VOC family protein [Thermoplasmata archaeon]|nr:VOC family protein [Thermoplasmata archaeon]